MTPAGLPIYTAQSNLNKFTNDGHCINYTIFHELTDGMRLHRANNNHTRPGGRALVKCINRPFKTAHWASGSARGACPCRAFFSLFLNGFSNPSLPRWSAIWQKFPIHTHGAAPPWQPPHALQTPAIIILVAQEVSTLGAVCWRCSGSVSGCHFRPISFPNNFLIKHQMSTGADTLWVVAMYVCVCVFVCRVSLLSQTSVSLQATDTPSVDGNDGTQVDGQEQKWRSSRFHFLPNQTPNAHKHTCLTIHGKGMSRMEN